jgi:hypothetical protein
LAELLIFLLPFGSPSQTPLFVSIIGGMNEDQLVPGPQVPSFELSAGGNDAAPANGNANPTGDASPSAVALAHTDDASRVVEDILQSDVGSP